MSHLNTEKLKEFISLAKTGDFKKILEIPEHEDVTKFLMEHENYQKDNYKWERLIALYIADESVKSEEISSAIYNFAEHDIFRYDDDGYVLFDLNIDLALIKSSRKFGMFDFDNVLELWGALTAENRELVQARIDEYKDWIDPSVLKKLEVLLTS